MPEGYKGSGSPPRKRDMEAKYWWREASDCLYIVSRLAKERDPRMRKVVCDKCHGMLERALKAFLARQGRLDDSDCKHNLRALAKKAGVFQTLGEEHRRFLGEIANLHVRATYPDHCVDDLLWYNEDMYKRVVTRSAQLYRIVQGEDRAYAEQSRQRERD